MTPKRIQRKRTKGWRMPEGAVYVGRPSKWGNPYEVRRSSDANGWLVIFHATERSHIVHGTHSRADARADAIARYRDWIDCVSAPIPEDELAGKDLACWCSIDQPCHADVLLEIANGDEE
jgi:hypothetical protein